MVILNAHTEAENILPMHAKNRSTKVTLLGCFLDCFPNREGEGDAILLAGGYMMLLTRN